MYKRQVLDKTMLGIYSPTVDVGYYDQSQKIVRILLTIITSLGMVMMPRIASLTSKNQHDLVKDTLKKSFTVIKMCIRDRLWNLDEFEFYHLFCNNLME